MCTYTRCLIDAGDERLKVLARSDGSERDALYVQGPVHEYVRGVRALVQSDAIDVRGSRADAARADTRSVRSTLEWMQTQ